MSAPPIYICADCQVKNVVQVAWRIGFVRPKGLVHIILPSDAPPSQAAAIAELTAICYLVESRQVGTSMRHHEVLVSQAIIKHLMDQSSQDSSLVPYGRHLYLYVDQGRLQVTSPAWSSEVEPDPQRISVTTAAAASWPEVFCHALKAKVGVTRHAIDRFIERCNLRQNHWHAFQAMAKRLESTMMRTVPPEEVARTNPGMRKNDKTVVLHHQNTDTAWIVVKEEDGWVLVTMHAHFQEFVPTFVRGRVEYRRNS